MAGVLVVDGSAPIADGGQSGSQVSEKEPREKARERVAPTVAKGPNLLGAGETALGPNAQEHAPRLMLHPRTQRRRHRPLLPVEMVGRGRASSIPGGVSTARPRSPPML